MKASSFLLLVIKIVLIHLPSLYLSVGTSHTSPCVTWPCEGPHLVAHSHPGHGGASAGTAQCLTASCLWALLAALPEMSSSHWALFSAWRHKQVKSLSAGVCLLPAFLQPCIWLKHSHWVLPGMLGAAFSVLLARTDWGFRERALPGSWGRQVLLLQPKMMLFSLGFLHSLFIRTYWASRLKAGSAQHPHA